MTFEGEVFFLWDSDFFCAGIATDVGISENVFAENEIAISFEGEFGNGFSYVLLRATCH